MALGISPIIAAISLVNLPPPSDSAHIILRSSDGEANTAIAERLGVSIPLVGHWRRRFRDHGLAGLYDAPRRGRPRTHDDDEIARMLRTVLKTCPKDATHWSVRSVAGKTGISKSTVQRYFALFGVQPHRTKSFKLSTDPFLIPSSSRRCATRCATSSGCI